MFRSVAFALALYPVAACADGLRPPFDPGAAPESAATSPADGAVTLPAAVASAPPARLESGKAFRLAFIHKPAAIAKAPPASPLEDPLTFFFWSGAQRGVDGD